MSTRTLTTDEVISEIAEILKQADGEFIAEIANKVFTDPVSYQEDSTFAQEIENDDGGDGELGDDEFECMKCHKVFDIEDSIRIGGKHGSLYCTDCAIGKCPSCHKLGIIGDACPVCPSFLFIDEKSS